MFILYMLSHVACATTAKLINSLLFNFMFNLPPLLYSEPSEFIPMHTSLAPAATSWLGSTVSLWLLSNIISPRKSLEYPML